MGTVGSASQSLSGIGLRGPTSFPPVEPGSRFSRAAPAAPTPSPAPTAAVDGMPTRPRRVCAGAARAAEPMTFDPDNGRAIPC